LIFNKKHSFFKFIRTNIFFKKYYLKRYNNIRHFVLGWYKNNLIDNSKPIFNHITEPILPILPILPKITNSEGIYLLKEREFIRMNENVYKIGRSKNIKQRISSYPKDSEVKLTFYCNNSIKIEKLLIKIFIQRFTQLRKYGTEYFAGNLDDMIEVITDNINSCIE